MNPLKNNFFKHLSQTSIYPYELEVESAEGIYIYDKKGKKYFDLISGICVCNTGHRHPKVIQAIHAQLEKYLHVMVYGDFIQDIQVEYVSRLTSLLPDQLQKVFLVNSGTEAVEGAIKLAKRYTGRSEIISFYYSYHGSTHGALSLMGNEYYKQAYRPLLPCVKFLKFNDEMDLGEISNQTAAVIIEPVQGEGGVRIPAPGYLKKLKEECDRNGALLIFDEVQTGFGRTGTLFAFEQYDVIPDILVLAKGIAGGLPLGAFIANTEIMEVLKENPSLGHISTFGGNPLSCAAALAVLDILTSSDVLPKVSEKGELFKKLLSPLPLCEIRGIGLMIALDFGSQDKSLDFLLKAKEKGVIVDWFLHSPESIRISPPLVITESEIRDVCEILVNC